MLSYTKVMKMYDEAPEDEFINRIKTLDERVKNDCENNLMGRILYAARAGQKYAYFNHEISQFNDKDYCTHYARKIKKYLSNYGYNNVSISFDNFSCEKKYFLYY